MAGYSGTPLPKKLGIKDGTRLALLASPKGFTRKLAPLPPGVEIRTQARGKLDVILFFATRRRELERRFPVMARALMPSGGLWVAWPKKASKVPTDITEDTVRDVVLPIGLVDVKVCAIDDTWSGLKVVWRRENR